MTKEETKSRTMEMVENAFGGIKKDKVSIIQTYISSLTQKIEHLESSALKSLGMGFISIIILFFITNNYLSDIEIGGVKIEKIQPLIPFFQMYIGYLIYVMCTSLINAINLEEVVGNCYELIAPGMKDSPLKSVFMIKTVVGAENNNLLPETYRINHYFRLLMWVIVAIVISLGSIAAMIYVCKTSIEGNYLPGFLTYTFLGIGSIFAVRGLIYFLSHLEV